jgi:hypothetical protein
MCSDQSWVACRSILPNGGHATKNYDHLLRLSSTNHLYLSCLAFISLCRVMLSFSLLWRGENSAFFFPPPSISKRKIDFKVDLGPFSNYCGPHQWGLLFDKLDPRWIHVDFFIFLFELFDILEQVHVVFFHGPKSALQKLILGLLVLSTGFP